MCTQIMYIIKNDFFPAFKHIFFVIRGPENIQLNFKSIGLVPYNPKKIINNLNFKFHIFTFSNFCLVNFTFINPNIFYTTKNAVQNFVNLKIKNFVH